MKRLVVCVVIALAAFDNAALAQEPYVERPDATRLDVERLPPEAIEITRDLYSQGLFVQGLVGGRGFVLGLGRYAEPGVLAGVEVGYELWPWLMLAGACQLSLHATDAPAPPGPSTFEHVEAVLSPRVQLAFSARTALWIGPEVGLGFVPGDLLRAYGYEDAHDLGVSFGGSLGFDYHLASRHHSLGLALGSRMHPSLRAPNDEPTLSIHALAYLKYVL
jgi:hypothetical protein